MTRIHLVVLALQIWFISLANDAQGGEQGLFQMEEDLSPKFSNMGSEGSSEASQALEFSRRPFEPKARVEELQQGVHDVPSIVPVVENPQNPKLPERREKEVRFAVPEKSPEEDGNNVGKRRAQLRLTEGLNGPFTRNGASTLPFFVQPSRTRVDPRYDSFRPQHPEENVSPAASPRARRQGGELSIAIPRTEALPTFRTTNGISTTAGFTRTRGFYVDETLPRPRNGALRRSPVPGGGDLSRVPSDLSRAIEGDSSPEGQRQADFFSRKTENRDKPGPEPEPLLFPMELGTGVDGKAGVKQL